MKRLYQNSKEDNKFKRVGLMVDCSRNAVPKVETIKKLADMMVKMGFNMLMLYTEDTYEIAGRPYFGYMRGRYSVEELKDIDDYCYNLGIECIPCIQTLAHLNAFIRWEEAQSYTDCNDILMIGNDETYRLIDDMFASLSKAFRSKTIHIGMDEAFMVGRGKYLDKNGYAPIETIMMEHLNKVQELAEKYGYQTMIWSDMLFRSLNGGEYYTDNPNIIETEESNVLPENIIPVYWDYYSTDAGHYEKMIEAHKMLGKPVWFAGGLWKWLGFAPLNEFSIKANMAALRACIEHNVENVFFTMWGDHGAEASLFSVLPSMFYTSQLIKGIEDETEIKKNFEEFVGIAFDDYMELDIRGFWNLEGNKDEAVNPSKYMLYNDYFCGLHDTITDKSRNEIYAQSGEKLAPLVDDEEYGYIFATIKALCDVLKLKNDIGIRTRKAYREKDRTAINELIEDYGVVLKRLDAFYQAFQTQWFRENKPFGFEMQDARIGGLMQRTKSCMQRLKAFADGEISQIPELDEDILDPECLDGSKRELQYNDWIGSFASVM